MHLNLRRSTYERSSSRLDDVLLGLSGRGQSKWPDSRRICADNAGPTHADGSRRLGVWGGECTSSFNHARSEVAQSTRELAATLARPITNHIWECGRHEMQLARRGLGDDGQVGFAPGRDVEPLELAIGYQSTALSSHTHPDHRSRARGGPQRR